VSWLEIRGGSGIQDVFGTPGVHLHPHPLQVLMEHFQIPVLREPPGFLCRHHSQSPPAAPAAASADAAAAADADVADVADAADAADTAAGAGADAAAADTAAGCQTESHREVHADADAGDHGGCAGNSGGCALGLAS